MRPRSLTTRVAASDRGFTLLEIVVSMSLIAILVMLGAGALRNFWFTQALYGGRDELVTELRRSQEQAVSESHPKVFGVRLLTGASAWGVVEYDPSTTPATCREISTKQLGSGTRVSAGSFAVTAETTFCRTNLRYTDGVTPVPNAGTSSYVFFYARGTATAGSATLDSVSLPGKTVSLSVTSITGRVTES